MKDNGKPRTRQRGFQSAALPPSLMPFVTSLRVKAYLCLAQHHINPRSYRSSCKRNLEYTFPAPSISPLGLNIYQLACAEK
jgi:hypothetical protein